MARILLDLHLQMGWWRYRCHEFSVAHKVLRVTYTRRKVRTSVDSFDKEDPFEASYTTIHSPLMPNVTTVAARESNGVSSSYADVLPSTLHLISYCGNALTQYQNVPRSLVDQCQ